MAGSSPAMTEIFELAPLYRRKSRQAQRTRQRPRPAHGIYALHESGQALMLGGGLSIDHRPKLCLQRNASAMAGKGEGAFFQHRTRVTSARSCLPAAPPR